MKPLLQPGVHKLIGCVRRMQGLMVAPGNPLGIRGLADISGSTARFINRQPGSGTRLLLDHLVDESGIEPTSIQGWNDAPEDSHVAVAAAVASGVADVGPGLAAAARQFGLDFVPLVEEDYFLVCLKDALEHPAVVKLREVMASAEWQAALGRLPGYAPWHSGEVLSLTQALPWWHFKVARAPGHPVA
jgi:putative molybdopterin biosynthesis protein